MRPTTIYFDSFKPSVQVFCLAGAVLLAAAGCQTDPVAAALDGIGSDSVADRLHAANVLLGSRTMSVDDKLTPRIEPALAAALKDDDADVRLTVARGVISWALPDLISGAVDAMIKDVASDDAAVRTTAVDVLATIPAPASTRGLVAALQTDDAQVRSVAARLLRRRGADLSPENRIRMWLTLDMSQDVIDQGDRALSTLAALLGADPALRSAAASAIAHLGDADAATMAATRCLDDLKSDDAAARAGAAEALGALVHSDALDALDALAEQDADDGVRASARIAAHAIRGATASIVQALDEGGAALQVAAIRGIRHLPSKTPAIPSLVAKLAADSGRQLAAEIGRTLESCGGDAIDELMDGIDGAADWSARLRLARALNQPAIYAGISQNQEFRLYNLQQGEGNRDVQDELASVLTALEMS